jgi:hypothetical protein
MPGFIENDPFARGSVLVEKSMLRPFLLFSGVAWPALVGCFDNPNAVGSINGSGGDAPIVVGGGGGAAGNANSTGGTGSGPGTGSGGTGGGATQVVSCRANGQQVVLSKACQSADDCVLISGSSSIIVPGTVTTSCTTLVVSIGRAEQARFDAFSASSNCPPPVGGCSLNDLEVQTEDGRVVPASATVSAQCDVDTCKSYSP